ncbi:cyclic nucleotide-binding domain-containing protein [Myxococcota bacterium]|nr:cyclic nucleotide-binding domain-containing protein [Myxococcota bacterium]
MNDVDKISSLYVFRSTPRADIEALCALAPPQDFAAGAVVFHQGDVADRALLVVEGRLEATVEAGGRVRRVGEVGPGEVVGEQALFHMGARRSATVSVLQPARCLLVDRALLERGADNLALVALETYLLGSMARRIRSTNRTLMQAWKETHPKPTVLETHAPTTNSLLQNLRRLFQGQS